MAKGIYKPLHPEKYLGDVNKIRFLSSWELRFMQFCDSNTNVVKWGSEELKIPYYHPIKKKTCHYYPDFIVKYKNKTGLEITEVIEIKPSQQSPDKVASGVVKAKKRTGRVGKKNNLYDTVQLVINQAKWTAARAFCEKHGIAFRVLTEHELFR